MSAGVLILVVVVAVSVGAVVGLWVAALCSASDDAGVRWDHARDRWQR